MTAVEIAANSTSQADPGSRATPVDDPTANLWACLDPATDRLLAAQALTGVDTAALLQLAAAEAVTAPAVRLRLEEGPLDPQFLMMVAAAEPMVRAVPAWAYDDELLRDARQLVAKATVSIHEANIATPADPPIMRVNPSLASVVSLVDKRTKQQHAVMLAVIALAVEAGLCVDAGGREAVPHLTVSHDGALVCPALAGLTFLHPGSRGSTVRLAGVRVGRILIDVPDYQHQQRGDAWESLRARSAPNRAIVAFGPADVVAHRDELVAEIRQSASSS